MWSRLHVRWGNSPHVTSPTWAPPPTCKQTRCYGRCNLPSKRAGDWNAKFHPGLHEGRDVRTDDFLRTKISWIFLTYGSPLRAIEISAISVFTSYFIEGRVFFRVFTFYAVHLSLSTRVWIHENPPFERNYIIAKEPKRDKHGASSLSSPKIYRKLITRLISIDRTRGPTRSGKAGHLSHFKNLSKVFFT